MSSPYEGFKILVADDSPVYRKLVEQKLSEEPCSVLFAKSGHEAMSMFSEHRPSLVITDRMMPDTSGIELCQHIRQHFGETYTYIIIFDRNDGKGRNRPWITGWRR